MWLIKKRESALCMIQVPLTPIESLIYVYIIKAYTCDKINYLWEIKLLLVEKDTTKELKFRFNLKAT